MPLLRRVVLVILALVAVGVPAVHGQTKRGPGDEDGHFPPPQQTQESDFSGFVVPGAFPGSDRASVGDSEGAPGAGSLDLEIMAGAHITAIQDFMGALVNWLLAPGSAADSLLPAGPHAPPLTRPVVAPPRALPAEAAPPLPPRRVYWVQVPAQPLVEGGPLVSGRVALASRLRADGRPVEAVVSDLGGTVRWASAGITGELEAGPPPGSTAITGELEMGVDDVISALAGIVGELEDLAISDDELDLRALNGGGAAGLVARDAMVGLLETLAGEVGGLSPPQQKRVAELLDILMGITGELEDLMMDFGTLSDLVAASL